MNGCEYLKRVGEVVRTLQIIGRKIDFCHQRADSTPDTSFSDEPRTPSESPEAPFVKWVYRALEWEKRADEQLAILDSMKEETTRLISLIPDVSKQMVLVSRYVEAKTWSQVADSVGYSKTHVMRLHEESMDFLEGVEAKVGT